MSNGVHYTVIGAGHGGKAMAADLAAKGFTVKLYNRTAERINEIALRREIELKYENGVVRRCQLAGVTSDIAEALDDADVIMVVVPASGHRDIARICAPHLRDGQIIILNPGRTGGALEVRRILDQEGCAADVVVAEAGTLVFASRSTGPAQARIFRRKNAVPLAALPATRTGHVLETVCEAYPQFIPVPNVLHTSLDNMGAIFHPALTLLNAGWIERTKGDFQFYIDGITHSTAYVGDQSRLQPDWSAEWRRMTAIRISMTEDHPGLRRPGSLLVPGRAASPTDHKISHD